MKKHREFELTLIHPVSQDEITLSPSEYDEDEHAGYEHFSTEGFEPLDTDNLTIAQVVELADRLESAPGRVWAWFIYMEDQYPSQGAKAGLDAYRHRNPAPEHCGTSSAHSQEEAEQEFAREIFELQFSTVPDQVMSYIDWERVANDYLNDCTIVEFEGNYYLFAV